MNFDFITDLAAQTGIRDPQVLDSAPGDHLQVRIEQADVPLLDVGEHANSDLVVVHDRIPDEALTRGADPDLLRCYRLLVPEAIGVLEATARHAQQQATELGEDGANVRVRLLQGLRPAALADRAFDRLFADMRGNPRWSHLDDTALWVEALNYFVPATDRSQNRIEGAMQSGAGWNIDLVMKAGSDLVPLCGSEVTDWALKIGTAPNFYHVDYRGPGIDERAQQFRQLLWESTLLAGGTGLRNMFYFGCVGTQIDAAAKGENAARYGTVQELPGLGRIDGVVERRGVLIGLAQRFETTVGSAAAAFAAAARAWPAAPTPHLAF